MAGGGPMTSSSKELTAIIVNLKEARILDKAVQTLALEESYASKLLDLNSKMVKFNYGRLKNNVNKIKTNLKPDEINVMRSLESEGKFKAEHPRICSTSSANKIAAAHKRLNLSSYHRAQSAMPRISQRRPLTRAETPTDGKIREKDEPQFSCSRKTPRPKTSVPLDHSFSVRATTPRPKSTASVLEKITRAQKANKVQVQVKYSCHDEKPPENDDTAKAAKKSVLDAFGPNPYEERRQKLLGMEGQAFTGFGDKKQGFIKNVGKFVSQNPSIPLAQPDLTTEIINSIDSMAARSEDDWEGKLNKTIDLRLVNKAIFTDDTMEREYYTLRLMRKGKRLPSSTDELFIPHRYRLHC